MCQGQLGSNCGPLKRKGAENDRREGWREEADTHGPLSRHASIRRGEEGGEKDPFREDTKAQGRCVKRGVRVTLCENAPKVILLKSETK